MHEGLMKKGLRSLLLQVPVFSAFKIKGYSTCNKINTRIQINNV